MTNEEKAKLREIIEDKSRYLQEEVRLQCKWLQDYVEAMIEFPSEPK